MWYSQSRLHGILPIMFQPGSGDSANGFPNGTDIVETVVSSNGSVYVLDSNQALYKFDGYSKGIQKVQLTPPGSPASSWYGADFNQLFRLWIHPQTHDPYLFRLRWSNVSTSENVLFDIIWYTWVNFNGSSSSIPSAVNVTFNTNIPVTRIGDYQRIFRIGGDSDPDARLQLGFYQGNSYYLALLDMKAGTQAPSILQDLNDNDRGLCQ